MLASGVVVHGFPFNTTQALLLDRYLNGVNLALHVKSGDSTSSDYDSLLKYYSERGSLLELDHNPSPTDEEIGEIQDKIKKALKVSQ